MKDFQVWSSFPCAPLTSRLILQALRKYFPRLRVRTDGDAPWVQHRSDPAPILQWSAYDSLAHELTLGNPTTVLSSSYTIRKSIIRKHFLHQSLTSYVAKHPDCFLSTHRGVPKTWSIDISWADELDEMWFDELYELGQLLDENGERDPKKWFIVKPSMSDRGQGIRLFETRGSLREIFESFEYSGSDNENGSDLSTTSTDGQAKSGVGTSVIASQLRHFVIQEYISAPLLLDPNAVVIPRQPSANPLPPRPRKFHIRAYCIASGALELFVDPNFLALFAGADYAEPRRAAYAHSGLDLRPHLTNTSPQTQTLDSPNPNDNVRLLSEMIGTPILSLGSGGERTLTDKQVESITQMVYQTLADTFSAALESPVHFQALPNAFELFGADLIVSHTDNTAAVPGSDPGEFTVSILELNSEPAIELTGERLSWMLESMFSGICQACVAPFFTKEHEVQAWEVGELRYGLYKCLSVQVRGAKGW